jgi:glycosyltransferase involved in cell wall biosynthesis
MTPPEHRLSVLFVYADRVGRSMGGVGIRALELARTVQAELGVSVTIAAAAHDAGADLGVPVVTFSPHDPVAVRRRLGTVDVVVAQPGWPLLMRDLSRSGCRLIFDLYDPEVFGTLETFSGWRRSLMSAYSADRVGSALRSGHHLMCANERQRDLWLGAMVGAGLISPDAWDRDPSFRSVLDVVPYGVPSVAPTASAAAGIRRSLGVGDGDELILWNGGLWSWLDPGAAIRATALLRARRPQVRLVFMGASDAGPAGRATREAKHLARDLGMLGSGVIFNDSWVPYEHRDGWLMAADCALSTHLEHLETRFSSRTRLLDCFWARLPIVCTGGDELADRVERENLGAVVPAGDPAAIAAGLERVLDAGRGAHGRQLAAAAADHAWSRVAEPLIRWLSAERVSPPLGTGRHLERRPPERLRAGAYLVGARTLAALRATPPQMR